MFENIIFSNLLMHYKNYNLALCIDICHMMYVIKANKLTMSIELHLRWLFSELILIFYFFAFREKFSLYEYGIHTRILSKVSVFGLQLCFNFQNTNFFKIYALFIISSPPSIPVFVEAYDYE